MYNIVIVHSGQTECLNITDISFYMQLYSFYVHFYQIANINQNLFDRTIYKINIKNVLFVSFIFSFQKIEFKLPIMNPLKIECTHLNYF